MEGREDNTVYRVVVNHEEQYSIWPGDRENSGLEGRGQGGTEGGLSGLYQRSLDGYETA